MCSSGRGVDSGVSLFFRFRARGAFGSTVEDVEGVGGRDASLDATDEGGGGILVCGKLSDEASGLRSSECDWEPGSAMVPTFFVMTLGIALLVPGSASAGDGDLPGEGGGDPNRDSSSSSSNGSRRWGVADMKTGSMGQRGYMRSNMSFTTLYLGLSTLHEMNTWWRR
jgi:hypothetical protein